MKRPDHFVAACRTMNYAKTTEERYTTWVVDFLRYHRDQAGWWIHPDHLRESAAMIVKHVLNRWPAGVVSPPDRL